MATSVEDIVAMENKLAIRNITYILFSMTSVFFIFVIVTIYKKRKISDTEARTDKLTDIGNRRAFFNDCKNVKFSKFKILYIDLSNFKAANDTYGHDFGDLILQRVANRLDNVSERSRAYRLGGDEFILVMPIDEEIDVKSAISGINIEVGIDDIEDRDDLDLDIDGEEKIVYEVKFACGLMDLSKFPEFNNLDLILKYVDLAMYEAKSKKYVNSSFIEVSKEFMKTFEDISDIESEIIKGKISDIFFPVFQPLLDVRSNKIIGYEALVRYKKNPKLSPTQFLKVLLKNGKLKNLDLFIFEEALKFLEELISKGVLPKHATISSNIGAQTIAELKVSDLDRILKKYDLTKDNIYLEISEESILTIDTLLNVHKLKSRGYKLAIDDFSAGNSSLAFLSELEVDIVKLDQQLLRTNNNGVTTSKRHILIYQSLTELSKMLGFKIVSEGVETKRQLDILNKFGVEIAQGYYISKPVSREDFTDIINKWNK